MFYTILHKLPWGKDMKAGSRNVLTFLIGSVLYVFLHAGLFHYYKAPGQLRWHLTMILISDAIAMATTYQMFYGRSLFNELTDDKDLWEYNAETHEYRRRLPRIPGQEEGDRGNYVDVGDIHRVVEDREAEDGEAVCTVCLTNVQNTLIAPCQHESTCFSCAQELDKCPVCMHENITLIPIFQQ